MKTTAWPQVANPMTYGGTPSPKAPNAEFMLRRSLLSTLLWEGQFYEDGESIAERIRRNVANVDPNKVASLVEEARSKYKLRHAPLLVVREMSRLPKHKAFVADALEKVIQRPDEMAEFLAIYWSEGKCPLSSQVKKGLSRAFNKFSDYQLAKYKNG
jgi:hypothetical protein